MEEETVYTVSMMNSDDPTVSESLKMARKYLKDSKGADLVLSGNQFERLRSSIFTYADNKVVTNNDLARLAAGSFEMLHSNVVASTIAMQQEVRAVGNLVAACHADTIAKLNALQEGIKQVNQNVVVLGDNIGVAVQAIAELRADFNAYVKKDEQVNNVQLAKADIITLNQKLEAEFSHNNELRRSAVGILQANDLNVRAETILTKAEELCIQTPNYWLAPALVVLANWISASRDMAAGKSSTDHEIQRAVSGMEQMLQESYVRECSKTALFFGLICRRANNIPEANQWFLEYMNFQEPRKVDHTCIVLLNIYAGGLMGHGVEEKMILGIMAGWLNELMGDVEDNYETQLVQDWKNTCAELYLTAPSQPEMYQALPAFCSQTWPMMQQVMQATNIHRELQVFLARELQKRDFGEDDLTLIDSMIADLVTDFDADELPLRRELEYQQLIVDLKGNATLAAALRGIKDDILSETKSFVSILSDAARSSSLSHASAATHVYAIRILMPWIKKAYLEVISEYREETPQEIQMDIEDFHATTVDGSNEEEVIEAFVAYVNDQEKQQLDASKTGLFQKVCLVGGVIVAVLAFIMTLVGGMGWSFICLIGLAAAGFGLFAATKARKAQQAIQENMSAKRTNGVLVIRQIMQEVRTWRAQYAANESVESETIAEIDGLTLDVRDILDH